MQTSHRANMTICLLTVSYYNSFLLDKACNYLKYLSIAIFVLHGTDLGIRTHQYDEKQGNSNTQALSTIRLLQVKEDWQTANEEGSKDEDRQEGAGARGTGQSFLLVCPLLYFHLLVLSADLLHSLRTLGERPFQYIGPVLWSSIPLSVRHSSSLSSFKSKLKTHLFSSAYWSVILPIHHQQCMFL